MATAFRLLEVLLLGVEPVLVLATLLISSSSSQLRSVLNDPPYRSLEQVKNFMIRTFYSDGDGTDGIYQSLPEAVDLTFASVTAVPENVSTATNSKTRNSVSFTCCTIC